MANEQTQGHNGHHRIPTGAERVRSGFDRRKNWGESIENVYRRIDERLSELVQRGGEKRRVLEARAEQAIKRNPFPALGACFLAGLLLGALMTRQADE